MAEHKYISLKNLDPSQVSLKIVKNASMLLKEINTELDFGLNEEITSIEDEIVMAEESNGDNLKLIITKLNENIVETKKKLDGIKEKISKAKIKIEEEKFNPQKDIYARMNYNYNYGNGITSPLIIQLPQLNLPYTNIESNLSKNKESAWMVPFNLDSGSNKFLSELSELEKKIHKFYDSNPDYRLSRNFFGSNTTKTRYQYNPLSKKSVG